jgi:hypothetical protein
MPNQNDTFESSSTTSPQQQDSNNSDSISSDKTVANTAPIVMAETIAHDVVKEAQSVGDRPVPSDEPATTSNDLSAANGQATQTPSSTSPDNADNGANPAVVANDAVGANPAVVANDAVGATAVVNGVVEDVADIALEVPLSKHESGTPGTSDSLAQALADASGGSDTDTSRADALDLSKDTDADTDAKGHMRTGSVKKPASFKPVSVTKSFLAKSLSASPVVRSGDKGA